MITHLEIAFQLLMAAILGGLVGLERERISWYAGLRTHMLVCIGSTLIMIVSQYGFEKTVHTGSVVLDPSRIAAQVVSGIGFLGAGTILFLKNKIKGLTTAASLWAVAAVGLAIGGELYAAAVFTTLLIVITLAVLKPIENFFFGATNLKEIKVTARKEFSLTAFDENLKSLNLLSFDLKVEKAEEMEIVHLIIENKSVSSLLNLADEIKKLPGVESIEIID